MKNRNGYTLTRQWLDFALENPAKVETAHYALMMVMIDLNNRLKWKTQFGLPTVVTMEEAHILSRKTYKKTFDDLVSWGFIKLIQKAKNNHTSNIIEMVIFTKSIHSQKDLRAQNLPSAYAVSIHIDK